MFNLKNEQKYGDRTGNCDTTATAKKRRENRWNFSLSFAPALLHAYTTHNRTLMNGVRVSKCTFVTHICANAEIMAHKHNRKEKKIPNGMWGTENGQVR